MVVPRNLPVQAEELLLRRFRDTSIQQIGDTFLNNFLDKYRDFYFYRVMVEPRRVPKSLDRCIAKIRGYCERGDAADEVDAINNHLKDLAGARLIFLFPADSRQSVDRLRSYILSLKIADGLSDVKLDGPADDKAYDTGYRAIHQGLLVKSANGDWHPYEVQFMNALQHVWDKIQGPLYRQPGQYPVRLHRKVTSLSKRCETMCTDFEETLQEIEACSKRAH